VSEKVFVCAAWPYTNGYLHLGHLAGCYMAADIFARYHRLKGDRVLMVSGSDQHGTPVTLRAEEEGVSPQAIVDRFRASQLEVWDKLGITFDLFTTTGTENHKQTVQDIFLKLLEKGLIYKANTTQLYDAEAKRFLPDRYVEGACPFCGNPKARGDQCDSCGKPMDPLELITPRSRLSGSAPVPRDSEHFFLKLSALQAPLLQWVRGQTHWRPNVLNFTTRYLEDGLHDRAITRDITWGVPIPLPGYEDKRIYVWFEACIGYLSAAKEWAQRQGNPDAWKEWWQDPSCKSYYFLGKDNIPFHTIIWPGMLIGYGQGLNLPYDVPANEYMNLGGGKFSKSEHRAVWVPDYLERYDPDLLRYYIAANMPETGDTEFSWQEFVRRNNDELVATYGNLAHRVLSFIGRNFGAKVPQPGPLTTEDDAMLKKVDEAMVAVARELSACHFREALRHIMALAQESNRYLDSQAPWRTRRDNPDRAATSLYVTMCAISGLKTLAYPFLPFSAQKLHGYLGFSGDVASAGWTAQRPTPGVPLPEPQALFVKLDDSVVEAEEQRMARVVT
jgi:methionyl-tRNA synthetase